MDRHKHNRNVKDSKQSTNISDLRKNRSVGTAQRSDYRRHFLQHFRLSGLLFDAGPAGQAPAADQLHLPLRPQIHQVLKVLWRSPTHPNFQIDPGVRHSTGVLLHHLHQNGFRSPLAGQGPSGTRTLHRQLVGQPLLPQQLHQQGPDSEPQRSPIRPFLNALIPVYVPIVVLDLRHALLHRGPRHNMVVAQETQSRADHPLRHHNPLGCRRLRHRLPQRGRRDFAALHEVSHSDDLSGCNSCVTQVPQGSGYQQHVQECLHSDAHASQPLFRGDGHGVLEVLHEDPRVQDAQVHGLHGVGHVFLYTRSHGVLLLHFLPAGKGLRPSDVGDLRLDAPRHLEHLHQLDDRRDFGRKRRLELSQLNPHWMA
jgi:hypothetical protein